MPTQTNIVVNLRVPGIHRWENCPLTEVAFLRDYHRHVFHIRAEKLVQHNDRDVEIIMFKLEILDFMRRNYSHESNSILIKNSADDALFFDYRSCEHIAHELLEKFDLAVCEVLEDGENGAIVNKMVESITSA